MRHLSIILLGSCVFALTACAGAGSSNPDDSKTQVEMYGVIDVGVGHTEVR